MPACDWLLVGCAITKYLLIIKLPSMIFEVLMLQWASMTGRYTHPNFISAEFCTAGQGNNGPQWSINYLWNICRVAGWRERPSCYCVFPKTYLYESIVATESIFITIFLSHLTLLSALSKNGTIVANCSISDFVIAVIASSHITSVHVTENVI